MTSYQQYFKYIDHEVLNIKQINTMLKQAIANSLEKKYHGEKMDELPSPEDQI